MAGSTGHSLGPHYCLRSGTPGAERSWTLAPGDNSLGSSETNDVVLPVAGVSRRHARLRTGEQEVELEDLSSTNGSFVNGCRVEQARLRPGDAIRFGPATLTLHLVDPGDIDLAIVLHSSGGANAAGLPDENSTYKLAEQPEGGQQLDGLSQLELFLDRLPLLGHGDLSRALAALQRELHGAGLCLFEWPASGEPLILASCGKVEDLSQCLELRRLVDSSAAAAAAGLRCRSGSARAPLPLTYAVLLRQGADPLCLVLCGGSEREGAATEGVLRVLVRLVERLAHRRGPATQTRAGDHRSELRFPEGFVAGTSPASEALYGEMRLLCRSELPLLIAGETGVGKEHVARALHASSKRCGGPFLAINCAAIPADLLEAELFGVADGAASGVRGREGIFQQARRGTLFLDEIGEMPRALQAKLLRVLQGKQVQPVGGRPQPLDVRILAATNRDLLPEVEAGRFRSDLYYRVAGAVLTVPPLRERREDIPPLVERFLETAAAAAEKVIRGISVKAMSALVHYPWPGNVRELENEIHRLAHSCGNGQAIDSTMLAGQLLRPVAVEDGGEPARADPLRLGRHVLDLERRLIALALEQTGGSQRQAATALGISRNALARKMKRLGISSPHAC